MNAVETSRQIIIRALADNPNRSARELAVMASCTRQRVHQIIKAEGLTLPGFDPTRTQSVIVPRISVAGEGAQIDSTACGTISELIAASDLTARGWQVFFPLVRTSRCDLIALSADGITTRRIEVRSGKRKGDTVSYQRRAGDTCDHYAVVLTGEPVRFFPDINNGK